MITRSDLLLVGGALLLAPLGQALNIPRHATVIEERQVTGSYDFVIAGGGVSGLTVADRLTENPNVRVLVIEAGPLDQGEDSILVPGAWNFQPWVWPLTMEPNPELNNRAGPTVVAKVVGGGSTANAMVWLRGAATDFNGFEALGNQGWGWRDMLPYYKKSENFTAPPADFAAANNISWDPSVRGSGGPVQYTYPNFVYPGSGLWVDAAKAIGMRASRDPNSGVTTGYYNYPFAQDVNRGRTRSHAKRNHYDRVIASRPNYHLLPNTHVGKVLFSGTTATGVEYQPSAGGSTQRVTATREVIVAAGALHTPQLLQLSGVGPRALLNSLRIPVVVDLPGVGSNLQEQYSLPVVYTFTGSIFPNTSTLDNNATWDAEQRALYLAGQPSAWSITRRLSTNFGALTLKEATGGASTAAYRRIIADALTRNPAASLPAGTDPTVIAGYAAQRLNIISQFQDDNTAVGSISWGTANAASTVNLKTLSRGSVTVRTTNPLDAPIINFRAASDPTDFAILVAMVRKQRLLAATAPFQSLGPTEVGPGPGATTDEQIISFARANITPGSAHQCCTAPMLPRALGGVLNNKLKVHGTSRLRVIDVSYWPHELSGPPTATMYATGEKIADTIKAEYGL